MPRKIIGFDHRKHNHVMNSEHISKTLFFLRLNYIVYARDFRFECSKALYKREIYSKITCIGINAV